MGIGASIEGVLPTLQSQFVAVIDSGRAGKREQDQSRQLHQSGTDSALLRRQTKRGTLSLGVRSRSRAQHRQDAGGVVGAQKIHGGVEGSGGIIFPKSLHRLPEMVTVASLEVSQQSGPEGIVHDPVDLLAQQVFPTLGISDLGAGVLPDLAQQQGIGICLRKDRPDLFNKPVRQLVCHIQPPTGGACPQPAADNRVRTFYNVIDVGGAGLPDRRQSTDAPPGVIIIRPGMEGIPVIIGAILTLSGAQRGIEAVSVKIKALRTGVVEDAVQHNVHPPRLGLCA